MSLESPAPPHNASDPYATFVSSSCIDLLLIEMVPMAYRIANDLALPSGNGQKEVDEDEQKDVANRKLEALGYRVGQGLVERYTVQFLESFSHGQKLFGSGLI